MIEPGCFGRLDTKAEILILIFEMNRFIHKQNYTICTEIFAGIVDRLESLPEYKEECVNSDSEILRIIVRMYEACDNHDMILLADYLEEGLKTWVISHIDYESAICVGNYWLEPSSCGLTTERVSEPALYLHSNTNPYAEAVEMVENSVDYSKCEYAVWGLALGYHVAALSAALMNGIPVTVYEEDRSIIDIFYKYSCVSFENMPNVRIIHDPSGAQFFEKISSDDCGLLMHYPSVKKIKNEKLREIIQALFIVWNTSACGNGQFLLNFYKNARVACDSVEALRYRFTGKDVLYIGGGPSMVPSIDFVKKNRVQLYVIVASTSLKKTLEMGVIPDCSVVLDPGERTYGHMKGIEDTTVPIIFASTAFWKFSENAKGERYIAFQKDVALSEAEAKKRNCRTYLTGGTVTSLAIDIAVTLGARRIYLAGVDLGFPDGKTHADGLMDKSELSAEGLTSIPSVNGGTVLTDEKMLRYLKWIETEIQNHPEVDFINLSECGAQIKGAHSIEG